MRDYSSGINSIYNADTVFGEEEKKPASNGLRNRNLIIKEAENGEPQLQKKRGSQIITNKEMLLYV